MLKGTAYTRYNEANTKNLSQFGSKIITSSHPVENFDYNIIYLKYDAPLNTLEIYDESRTNTLIDKKVPSDKKFTIFIEQNYIDSATDLHRDYHLLVERIG